MMRIDITGYITKSHRDNRFTIKVTSDRVEHPLLSLSDIQVSKEIEVFIKSGYYPFERKGEFISVGGDENRRNQINKFISLSETLREGDRVKCSVCIVETKIRNGQEAYIINLNPNDVETYAKFPLWLYPNKNSFERLEADTGDIMTDNTTSKLRVSRAEASEKIHSRIDIGKELLETEILSAQELANLKHKTGRWTDYNKTLFLTLFDESPLSEWHGLRIGSEFIQWVHETKEYKRVIAVWIDHLEIVYEKLELYEELPNSTQQTMSNDTINNEKKKIFIGHGRSLVWREFKDFLVETLGLEYEEFDRISAAGKSINNRLEEMLGKSCMAFLIMTGEDEYLDGSSHARQNVIHEIGKCQDRLGSERAIILLEKGCEKFSNMDGIIYIDFTKGNIKETFGEIVKVLIRESIIRIELCN